jgi:IPT/TIG domain
MSLGKRHIGRRVAGVGVAVALMALGLQAPAFAAPAVASISPTSGPEGCVVVITGTGFDQPGDLAIDDVGFTGAAIGDTPALFHVVSDTEIWTTVPDGAATGAIRVTDLDANTSDSAVFTVTEDDTTDQEGGCGPTITSFTPTCGTVGTVVTITGTNLLDTGGNDATSPDTEPTGGVVSFNPYTTAIATHTGAPESPTTLVVNVPATAVDGAIRVDTGLSVGDDNVDSTTAFNVVTDPAECGPVVVGHPRAISFKLKKTGKASGVVSSTETTPFTACVSGVPVKIQKKKKGGGFKTLKTTTTSDTGSYKAKIKPKKGKYRALAPKVAGATAADDCLKAKSAIRKLK